MTITESELREILQREGEDGPHRGVTVADVDRRVSGLRRRRARVLGGVAALGLAVTAAFTLSGPGAGNVSDDIWTGVMAQPEVRYGTRTVSDTVTEKQFSTMGERLAFDLPERRYGTMTSALINCPPQAEVLYWENGRYRNAGLCNQLPADGDRSKPVTVLMLESDVRRLEIAVVPPGSIRGLGRPLVNERDARQVVRDAPKKRADMGIIIVTTRYEPCESGPGCPFADQSTVSPTCPGGVPERDPDTGQVRVVYCPEDGKDAKGQGAEGGGGAG
ncbi:hypothetical protein [Streptosporangium sp. NBC_01756]|uniref:hypothetical protein n=1 Tax=Streptosporangium sp. NBC_01756 TaxID=2975950 RepID=UPI002DD89BA2|nr:hypothetical protein [Streptosporangium sp. NBC_01756]WSC87723.1 hypothetical protein OIE48_05785 [Streptosporangium sp. NBC_01756]